ncbi:sucrase ferredoxin [Nocardioides terrigena]|uniref:sucrase ferredoxin n=1 Tax=Nocardioides terrigena TaxID=424797 RepID=UPI000D300BEF|nr:sucrase ferredoxin [Nocardioides terrigena]
MAEPFRCAADAAERGDPLPGSASTFPAFLLLEHPGPWGVDALRDARLPDGLGAHLASAARGTGVRVLLARRHRGGPARTSGEDHPGYRVIAAHTGAGWSEGATVPDLADVAELDLAALGAGVRPGWAPMTEPVLAVCTHGRHDACCAERGRPVAAALAAAHPDLTWEVSHVGGDRFAANLVVLPHGLYYGGLDPAGAVRVAAATLDGHVVLDHLRGRSRFPMPVQAAEVALRHRLGETRLDAVELRGHRRDGDLVTARFEVDRASYDVVVREGRSVPARLTCRAGRDSAAYTFETLSIT